MSATPTPYDFRERRRISPAAIRVLERWMADATSLGNDMFQQLCGCGELRSPTVSTADSRSHVGELPDPGYGFEVHVGSERATSLVALSQSLALELVARTLGGREPGTPPVADRDLSRAELAVLEMVLQQLLPASCKPGQPMHLPSSCSLRSLSVPADRDCWGMPSPRLSAIGLSRSTTFRLP